MFEHIPSFAGDPILSLLESYLKDPREYKVNASIGLYYDEDGKVPLLAPVLDVEETLVAQHQVRSYLPMEGEPVFRLAAQKYAFGPEHEAVLGKRIASIQTLGGSGGLSLTAAFMRRFFPDSQIWISEPTWENHRAIFSAAGVKVNAYPYYDLANNKVLFDEMLACIEQLPERSLVLLHPCCHNPTGMGLSNEQWARLIPVFKARHLMAYLDIAYQGLGVGIEEDAWALREFASAGVTCFVGSSFSKTFSLYGERIGALHVVCASEQEALCVLGQYKAIVRQTYSSPPTHGAMLVGRVLEDAGLRKAWEADVNRMRFRIIEMRRILEKTISAKVPGKDFSYFTAQQGMFSYTGFNEAQVDRLREEFAVYLVRSGRMCVAGLNHSNVEYVAQSMAEVMS